MHRRSCSSRLCPLASCLSVETLVYTIALIQLPGIGDLFAKLLVEYFKSAKNIFIAPKKELQLIPGIGRVLLATLCNSIIKRDALIKAQKEYDFTQQHKISIWSYDDLNYPQRLRNTVKGRKISNMMPIIILCVLHTLSLKTVLSYILNLKVMN